eukprot:CAMPEP_0170494574 /NCGR_PEP_ID=MMETSP0208-20121228/14720_1 /TAXON_ID=197538 /ORGANISM="Strombidium inclinatum, Strain S3" /LENGTH=46 /DNA_ID= /DNA_START= /DNA_END= /DNA_ORIENTATION=
MNKEKARLGSASTEVLEVDLMNLVLVVVELIESEDLLLFSDGLFLL